MINVRTYLTVADNTGARQIMCIRSMGCRRSTLGQIIIAVVKESLPGIYVRRSEVVLAVVVRTRLPLRRVDGSRVRFNHNAAVIINKEGHPRGSRIFGPIPYELRNKNFIKIVSLACEVILFVFLL